MRLPVQPLAGVMALMAVCSCSTYREADMAAFLRNVPVVDEAASQKSLDAGGDAPDSPAAELAPMGALAVGGAMAPHAATIQKDCLLKIRVKEDPALNGSYPVNDIGAVQLGYVGPVILFNKTEAEAERKIQQILEGREFKNATVDVEIIRASYDRVQVVGHVVRPGVLQIGAGDGISLNDALLRAGGLKISPKDTRITIVREGMVSVVAPALGGETVKLLDGAGKPAVPDIVLRNNDIAYVYDSSGRGTGGQNRPVTKQVLVLGEVPKEGFYRFQGTDTCTLMHLIFKMGGLPRFANDKAIRIIRRNAYGAEEEFTVNARRILKDGNPDLDIPLEDGDRVIVPEKVISLF